MSSRLKNMPEDWMIEAGEARTDWWLTSEGLGIHQTCTELKNKSLKTEKQKRRLISFLTTCKPLEASK
tara:strand:- start:502 stop:705 length:204 start_codon:yes stop_codon:yes gene_type:complete